ncbi:hypothetical protein G9A89_022840 [Geosiphon pyriformis]|nr:hypothetical protein G9A89_022840 [Geosiphon pyriformis]
MSEFDYLVWVWSTLDNVVVSKFLVLYYGNSKSTVLLKHLSKAKKNYCKSKYYEAKLAKNRCIRNVIDKHMKNFILNKDSMIKSVLEQSFCKVVLDYLVIGDELILEPGEQYILLEYVNNAAFLGVMCNINLGELSLVVSSLPNRKTAGLSGISNKLWKHYGDEMMACLLNLQEHLCGYKINSNFVMKTGKIETSNGKSSFFAAGVFVDDTIWIGNGQASIQYILDITSEFFKINDISINNDKTVVIPIN